MPGVVEHLHLDSRVVRLVAFLGHAVEHPAVAGRSHLPLQRQLEVAELLVRYDVTSGSYASQLPIDRLPPVGSRLLLVAAPAIGRSAIEKHSPALRTLRGGQ